MIVIGECIHVISSSVKKAIETRDAHFIQNLAKEQVAGGAEMIDLNVGPRKRDGAEVMPWMVNTVQAVTDVPLSLDTTNAVAIEAGLKVCKKTPIINSTDATEARLEALMPLAARYNANIIALTLAETGLPTTADARIELAMERIMPAAEAHGVPMERIFFDPLVMTINGNQDQALQTINAVRFFKQMSDPPPQTTCGLSNISNQCPAEIRPLLNRVFLIMMAGAGLYCAIADPMDKDLMEAIRIIKARDNSTAKAALYLALYDAYEAGEEFDTSSVDQSVTELRDIGRTVDALQNKWIYAHSYLSI
ncbi:MAG: dihydropteroate synthase [Chloroflexi bacterium]|nr:dihydropteroate synthase [Chloroflexota bacterium]